LIFFLKSIDNYFKMIYYILMMMIKKETAKAYQLETEDGKLFWIQKRWMREDGTLTAAN